MKLITYSPNGREKVVDLENTTVKLITKDDLDITIVDGKKKETTIAVAPIYLVGKMRRLEASGHSNELQSYWTYHIRNKKTK